jgi:hypothetical protein
MTIKRTKESEDSVKCRIRWTEYVSRCLRFGQDFISLSEWKEAWNGGLIR